MKNPQARPPRKDIFFIDVALMIPSYVTNVRDDYGEIEEMVQTIIESPERLPPLRGHKDVNGYIITDGHRRIMAGLIAAERTGKKILLPFIAEPQGYTNIERLTDMFLLNEGKPLTMMEQAKGIKRFIDEFDLKPKEVAKKIHKSITYINNCLLLIDAPATVKEHIAGGIIKSSTVIELMKKKPIEEVATIIQDTIDSISKQPDKKHQSHFEFYTAEDSPVNSETSTNAKREIGIGAAVEDDGAPLIVESEEENQFRNSNEGGVISGLKVRVTKRDIDNTLEKYNSVGAFKKMLKKYPETTFNMREDKAEELAFFQNVIEGNVSGNDLWNRYFHISSEQELKEQL